MDVLHDGGPVVASGGGAPARTDLWSAVDVVIDRVRAGDVAAEARIRALRDHRIHLLLAARCRATGAAPPASLRDDERLAAIVALATPAVLARARAAFDGPLMVMKGPEVGARYPDPSCRPHVDLDLLAGDPEGAQRALLAAGFRIADPAWFDGPDHQLAPLCWPGLPLTVEIHRHPHWVDGLQPPATAELLEAAGPSRVGVPGLLAPAPEHHALMLAVHGWAHRPLGRLGPLIDVEALRSECDPYAVVALARAWRCERLWRSTCRAAEAVLHGGPAPLALRTWARHLRGARERTVLAAHAERWLAPAWGQPARRAAGASLAAAVHDLRPHAQEGWRAQSARMQQALTRALHPEPDHLAVAPRSARELAADRMRRSAADSPR